MSLSGDMEQIGISDELHDRLIAACRGKRWESRRTTFEQALNDALDAAGWPRGPRGQCDVPLPPSYWYVSVLERGRPVGHVGPIHELDKARRAARSWRETGRQTRLDRVPVGNSLTNPG